MSFFSGLIALCPFALISNPDSFEATLWKKGKDNKQFLKRRFLLSRADFTLRYFVKEDVSCVLPGFRRLLRPLTFTVIMFLMFEPSNQVHGSQSCHLHERPERSLPAGEDPPRSRPADLLPAWPADEESLCVSRGRTRESLAFSRVSSVCSVGSKMWIVSVLVARLS